MTVYKCERRRDNKIFAVKIIDKTNLTENERELMRTEVAILKLVHHAAVS